MNFESIWSAIKKNIIVYIAVTISGLTGVKAWLAEQVLSKLLDEYIKPLIQWLQRCGIIWSKKIKDDKAVKELDKAKTNEEIDHSVDNIP